MCAGPLPVSRLSKEDIERLDKARKTIKGWPKANSRDNRRYTSGDSYGWPSAINNSASPFDDWRF